VLKDLGKGTNVVREFCRELLPIWSGVNKKGWMIFVRGTDWGVTLSVNLEVMPF